MTRIRSEHKPRRRRFTAKDAEDAKERESEGIHQIGTEKSDRVYEGLLSAGLLKNPKPSFDWLESDKPAPVGSLMRRFLDSSGGRTSPQ